MENLSAIIESIASLAWPVIVIIIILGFRSAIGDLIGTAKSRKFTVKVAGNELTMEEVNDQQRRLISDLQKQFGELQTQVDALLKEQPLAISKGITELVEESTDVVRLVLWVDDNPKNNSFLIQTLQDQGTQVVTAVSTKEALEKMLSTKFERIITDMGRTEDGRYNPIAGLELTRMIRQIDANVPIFVFTNSRGAQNTRVVAEAGVTGITTSPSSLLGMLQTR